MNFILIDLIFLFFPFRPDGGVYCNTHDEGVSYGSLCVSTMVHLMCANLFYRIECKKFNSHKIFMYTSLQEKHVYMQITAMHLPGFFSFSAVGCCNFR